MAHIRYKKQRTKDGGLYQRKIPNYDKPLIQVLKFSLARAKKWVKPPPLHGSMELEPEHQKRLEEIQASWDERTERLRRTGNAKEDPLGIDIVHDYGPSHKKSLSSE